MHPLPRATSASEIQVPVKKPLQDVGYRPKQWRKPKFDKSQSEDPVVAVTTTSETFSFLHNRTKFSRGLTFDYSDSLNFLVPEDDNSSSSTKSPSISPISPFSGSTKQKYESSGFPLTRVGFSKLARLLSSKDKTAESINVSSEGKRGTTTVRKATSIDSLLNVSCTSSHNVKSLSSAHSSVTTSGLVIPNNKHLPFSPSVPCHLENQKRIVFPSSPGMPNKLTKAIPGMRHSSVDVLLEGLALTKAERKKLEKISKFNINLQALFVAVEHEHVERAHTIFETTNVDVNSVNGDGFTPLDIAIMTNSIPMVKLLQSRGGRESTRYPKGDSRSSHLNTLVKEAERCVEELKSYIVCAATNSSLSAALVKEKERQLVLWERRRELLKRMSAGFEHMRVPDPPKRIHLEVAGIDSLRVRIEESESAKHGETIVTKYKVECSTVEDFSSLVTSQELTDLHRLEVTIPDLIQNTTYFVQVAAGNSKGFSSFQTTCPSSAVPSSWKDLDNRTTRGIDELKRLEDLFHQVINSRSSHAAEMKVATESRDVSYQHRRQVKKSIKNLFASTPNFQKYMKRGVYLACIFYHDNKLLVTTEETVPILEVDDSHPSSLHTDFHWLMKIACTWKDVKALRHDMEKSHSSSTLHFRSKLLRAIEQMQAALGTYDLGQLFYKPFKDVEGTLVITTVKYVSDPKSQKSLSVRWLPLAKIHRKLPSISASDGGEIPPADELLLSSLQVLINYNHVSILRLSRGLYLGYVKLKSSVDVIRVFVPWKVPNVLPFCRIRDNPHVTKEEWAWMQSLASTEKSEFPTAAQLQFQKLLTAAVKNLCCQYNIPAEQINAHRIYNLEVIELSPDVSFLLMIPPTDYVCSVPGQTDDFLSRADCIPLPVQIFEMVHMMTYNSIFISRYSRLSSVLEMDTMLAQHAQREAFSAAEVTSAKDRLSQLQEFQTQVDNTWRSMRWVMDVLTFARDKQPNGGVPLDHILIQDSGSPSPQPSPHQSPIQELFRCKKENCTLYSEDTISDNFLKVTTSSSYLALQSSECRYKEIRRSVSTSHLLKNNQRSGLNLNNSTTSGSPKNSSINLSTSTVELEPEEPKLTITSYLGSLQSEEDENEQEQEWGLDLQRCTAFASNGSMRSSITDSIMSLSSHEADGADDEGAEKTSIYSKDGAHSIGEGTQPCQDVNSASEDETSDSDLFSRLSSPYSSSGSNPQPDILRIYAAYESGLSSGTSVKLHVSSHTTAREIVNLVVKQLNMAVILKGLKGPIYGATQLKDFCLTVVLDTRERCLSDEFKPLSLQNPWTRGKLLVRLKSGLKDPSKQ